MDRESAISVFVNLLRQPRYLIGLVAIWLGVLGIFLWINRLNLLAYILSQPDLTLEGKVLFVLNVYKNLLINLDSPLAISIAVFALLTALNILLLVFIVRAGSRLKHAGRANASVLAAAAGSHVLSCGGTLLLAPLFPALAGSGAIIGGTGVIVNQALGVIANIIGSLIVVWSIRRAMKPAATLLTSAAIADQENRLRE